MAETISITYDLLFDILRYEKSRDDLQTLDENFFKNLVDYIKSKELLMIDIHTAVSERELTRIQINNIKKIVAELYERREKKIINLALYKIKTGADTINTASLLKEEHALFDAVVEILSKYKASTLDNVLNGIMPSNPANIFHVSNDVSNDLSLDSDDVLVGNSNGIVVSVRFLKPVPRFLGPELENYGPFEEDDIASLPSNIAKILVKKNRAEQLKTK